MVGNAGATWGASFEDYPASAFDKVLTVSPILTQYDAYRNLNEHDPAQLNVSRVFQLTQALTPLLLKGVGFAHQDGSMTFTDPARVINVGLVLGPLYLQAVDILLNRSVQ